VGMQQRRHALQQGEQRDQDGMANFHLRIIGGGRTRSLT
jgi:hypothetical protein